jgi:hypothetical protein
VHAVLDLHLQVALINYWIDNVYCSDV